MNESTVCFINTASTQERIQVADAQSAEILKRIFAQLENQKWVIEGTGRTSSGEAPRKVEYLDLKRDNEKGAKEFKVVLISGNTTFRCGTCEVSLEGMKLKNPVPASFNETQCLAYLSHNNARENIELTCAVITDSEGVSRLQFTKLEQAEFDKLSEWIAAEAN